MITISENLFGLIGVGTILFYIIMFAIGWHKGIIRAAIDLVGTIVAVWLSWLAAPAFAEFISLWPSSMTPLQGTPVEGIIYTFINEICIFFLVFVILKIMIALLENLCREIRFLPGINLLASAAGGVFQLVVGVLWTLVLSAVLSMPVFVNGRALIEHTVIGRVCAIASEVATDYVEPFVKSEEFGEIVDGASDLQAVSQDAIRAWFAEHGDEIGSFKTYTEEAAG